MFLILLTYKKPLTEVDHYLSAHREFLQHYYDHKNFIVSGGRNPRSGGVILCKAMHLDEVQQIISNDPFYRHEIADYEIIEFNPTMFADEFACYL